MKHLEINYANGAWFSLDCADASCLVHGGYITLGVYPDTNVRMGYKPDNGNKLIEKIALSDFLKDISEEDIKAIDECFFEGNCRITFGSESPLALSIKVCPSDHFFIG